MSGVFPAVTATAGQTAALGRAATTAITTLLAHPESRPARQAVASLSVSLALSVAGSRTSFRGLMAAVPPGTPAGHAARTAVVALGLGRQLELSAAYLAKLCEGALCHDLGESLISADVLDKRGVLSEAEWRLVRQHPRVGVELLSVHGPLPAVTRDAILAHHERLDGSGYPFGLEGAAVPLPGRILGLADSYEALSRPRPDGGQRPGYAAVEAIAAHAAAGFDRDLFRELVVLLARSDEGWSSPA